MSSVARYASKAVKLPAGRMNKAQPDQQFLTCLDYEPYCFQKSDIDALLSSGFIKVSDSLYSAETKGYLDSVLNSLDNLNMYWFNSEEYTAVDLGKTIRIGVAHGDNDVITMRLVKRTGYVESFGRPSEFPEVCYIVTGNKMGHLYNDALYCSVLGTTPNNRTRKPFINNGGYNPLVVSVETLEAVLSSTVKVSGSLYLANNVSDFNDVLSALDNSSNYERLENEEASSLHLGKTIRVGIADLVNDLVVFRLVKRTGNVASAGGPNAGIKVGYVCIASKINRSDPEGAAEPAVMGSTPNALEVKPQFLSNGGYDPAVFPEAELKSILAECQHVSSGLYLATSASQLASVCNTLNNWSGRDYFSSNAMCTVDMGKTIRLGLVGGESDLLTFASSRGVSEFGNGADLTNGYVVVASKISQDYNDALSVSVLGSAPRDC
jgi:hypothetical protein